MTGVRSTASQVAAVAFWSSATAGVMTLLAVEAMIIGGAMGWALCACIPFACWGGGSMRSRALEEAVAHVAHPVPVPVPIELDSVRRPAYLAEAA